MAAKPHVVFLAYPAQSHIKAMLKLAKLLHIKGVQVTFVNSYPDHLRFLEIGGASCLDGLPDFQFATIPFGPSFDVKAPNCFPSVCERIKANCFGPFLDLMANLSTPPTCIVSDGFMTFSIDAAQNIGVPIYLYWTLSACGFMACYQLQSLKERGIVQLKDENELKNVYLETTIDGIPGMGNLRLMDLPNFIRMKDANELLFDFTVECTQRSSLATHMILHTFDELERDLVDALKCMFSNVYTIGPLQLLLNKTEGGHLEPIRYSLRKEETDCLKWLELQQESSVLYVNFGSSTVMSNQDLLEFGWGLANSEHNFFWVIRNDLVKGEAAKLPPELLEIVKERSFFASWCPQEEVLNHPAVSGFLTHGGWGSTIESLSAGVPMICWPFIADQPTLCRYICTEWKVGMEIGYNVNRDEVERLVRELMDGETGMRLKKKAMEWKKIADIATDPRGSSSLNVEKLLENMTTHLK